MLIKESQSERKILLSNKKLSRRIGHSFVPLIIFCSQRDCRLNESFDLEY